MMKGETLLEKGSGVDSEYDVPLPGRPSANKIFQYSSLYVVLFAIPFFCALYQFLEGIRTLSKVRLASPQCKASFNLISWPNYLSLQGNSFKLAKLHLIVAKSGCYKTVGFSRY